MLLVTILSDRKSVIQLAANLVFHKKTKHKEIDCHIIRDKIKARLIETIYVHTQEKVVDLLTKYLGHIQYLHLLGKIGVLNILHLSA